MSNTLSARSTRRLAQDTGVWTITRAWGLNGTEYGWATWDHEHGRYNKRTGAVEYSEEHHATCYGPDGILLTELEPFEDDGRWPLLYDRP